MTLFRSRRTAMLFRSLLMAAAGALLPATSHAAAVDTCSFGGHVGSPTCSLDFVFDKAGDKTLKLVKLPTIGKGTIQFNEATSGIYVVDVDFIPDLAAPAGVSPADPGLFEYDLTIDPAPGNNSYFRDSGLTIVGPPLGDPIFAVMKSVSDTPVLDLAVDQTNLTDTGTFNALLKTIRVVDTYSVGTGSVNSFQNSFRQQDLLPPPSDVPGPLPLLGAGAAFCFSRRLRSRLKAARQG